MTLAAVTNTPWALLDDCKDALEAAVIEGARVFPQVVRTAAEWQPPESQYRGETPIAVLRQTATHQYDLPDDVYGGLLTVELSVVTQIAAGVDQHESVQECLRLIAAAKNAIESDPPDDAVAMGGPDIEFHHAIEWGDETPMDALEPPWVGFAIPLELSYKLDTSTSH